MIVYVAYNTYGDLIAEADSYNDLMRELYLRGIDEDDQDVMVGKVTA